MDSKKEQTKTKTKGPFNWKPIIIIAGAIALVATIFIGFYVSQNAQRGFPLSLLALFAGLIFETFRISDHWKKTAYLFIGTYAVSLIAFVPFEGPYNFDEHLEAWPYTFILLYVLITIINHEEKVTAQLTEGITLLQSLSMIYWVLDVGMMESKGWADRSIFYIILAFSLFSVVHALTHLKLTRGVRLSLSIWSSFVMFAFGFEYIYSVSQNSEIERCTTVLEGASIGLQYFLLGVSIIYISQNIILLIAFLPSKNGNFKEEWREAKEAHIARYSEEQTPIIASICCIFCALLLYGLNYRYHMLPRSTMIWLLFFSASLILKRVEQTKKNPIRIE